MESQIAEPTRPRSADLDLPETQYRPISPTAVLALIIGLVAVLTLTFPDSLGWYGFAVIPAVGIIAGFNGIKAVRRYDAAGLGLARTGLFASVLSLFAGYGIMTYAALTEVPEGATPITYEQLQPKPGEMIASSAEALDGQRVFVKGYVYPGNEMTGIKKFMLCRDNSTCCFGGQPKMTDMIEVTLKEPLELTYTTSLRHVAGVFKVKPEQSFNNLGGVVYHLEADYLR